MTQLTNTEEGIIAAPVASMCTSSLTSTLHNDKDHARQQTNKENYKDWRTGQGTCVTTDLEEQTVIKYVRETLFGKVKFINSDEELEHPFGESPPVGNGAE